MTIYLIGILLLTLFYGYIMTAYLRGWKQLPYWDSPNSTIFSTKVSILIPARDEEDNIFLCLESALKAIEQTRQPELFEIIVIDDFSTDNTAQIVQSFSNPSVQLLQLKDFITESETQSFKKKALGIAIEKSKGDLIITTDADCTMNANWLNLIVSYYEKHQSKFIAVPVQFHEENSLFEQFQSLDFLGMMVITGGGIQSRLMNMCNGANLAFEKKAFYEVDGYEGIDKKASGDDMMLMQKIAARYPQQIGYVKNKNACTYTKAKPTVRAFFNQRVRWTTKSGDYQEKKVTATLGMVWLFCVSILVSFGVGFWEIGLGQLFLKGIIDYRLLGTACRFFGRWELMRSFWASSMLHLFYIVVVGGWGNFVKNYEWKGRKVS